MSAEPARLTSARALPLGAIFGGVAAMAIVAVGLLRLDHLPFPVCYLKAFTGIPCPTCGTTRAMARLFALDFTGALAMNPLTTVVVLALLVWAVVDLILLPGGKALRLEPPKAAGGWLRISAVVAVLANWVYLVWVGR